MTFPTWGVSIQHTGTVGAAELAGLLTGARWTPTAHPALQAAMQAGNRPPSGRTAHFLNHAADATARVWGKAASTRSLLAGALGWTEDSGRHWASSLSTPGHLTWRRGCPALPWHKTLRRQSGARERAAELPGTGSEGGVEKHHMRRTESCETANKLAQKPHDAHAGSGDQNFTYKMCHLPYTRQCSQSSTEISYRGWEDCLRPPAGEDCETSSGQCSALFQKIDAEWDKQWEKNPKP